MVFDSAGLLANWCRGDSSVTRNFLYASCLILSMSGAAFGAENVTFTMKVDQQSLRDKSLFDTFTMGLADKRVETNLTIKCQAATGGIIGGQNEPCAVIGNGVLVNPANGQKIQRTQIAGGWVEKSDSYTDAATLKTKYLAVGKVAASEGAFSGSLMLKPKVPSTTASLLVKQGNIMEYVWIAIVGLCAAVIAKLILPGRNGPRGVIGTTLVGVTGSFVGSFLGQFFGFYRPGGLAGVSRCHRDLADLGPDF